MVFFGKRVILNGTSKTYFVGNYKVTIFVENSKIKFKVCKSGSCKDIQEAVLKSQLTGEAV